MFPSGAEMDLYYAARVYTVTQVEPHAKACKEKGCPSYIHCFFGMPRGDNSVPMPVCAQKILAVLRPNG